MSEDTCYRQQLKTLLSGLDAKEGLYRETVMSIQTRAAVQTSISDDFNRLFT